MVPAHVSTAKLSLDRRFVTLSTPELNYLLLNLTVLENQLARYRMADPDFVEQAQNAAGAGRFMSQK